MRAALVVVVVSLAAIASSASAQDRVLHRLALPIDGYERLKTFGDANRVFIDIAQRLGARALDDALARSGVPRESVGALFFVTTTGVAIAAADRAATSAPACSRGIPRPRAITGRNGDVMR